MVQKGRLTKQSTKLHFHILTLHSSQLICNNRAAKLPIQFQASTQRVSTVLEPSVFEYSIQEHVLHFNKRRRINILKSHR